MSSDAPTDADGTPWPDISFVARSKHRTAVLLYLARNGPAMPSRISEETPSEQASVSHALTSLRERGLVELLVDDDIRKGRIYGLTDAGAEIARELEERGMT